jgi:cobalt/nickel transport system permease protein
MLEEPFAIGDSHLHRLDPRIRVVFAGLLSSIVAVGRTWPALFTALGLALALTALAKLRPGLVARRLFWVNTFIVLLWLILPFSYEGQKLFSFGPFTATEQGVLITAQITLKSNIILLLIITLIATMPTGTLGHALNALRFPAKIVHLLLMTYRYIFVLEQESQRLMRAAKIRGFSPGTSLHAYKTYAYLVGMLFVKASERADRVYHAMKCRGFNGRFHCLHTFGYTGLDGVMTILLTGMLFAIVYLNYTAWTP